MESWHTKCIFIIIILKSIFFQHLFPNLSRLASGRTSTRSPKISSKLPLDRQLMVTWCCFLEMEKSQNGSVAGGWLSTLWCWEAAVHTHDWSWKKIDVKMMKMMIPPRHLCILVGSFVAMILSVPWGTGWDYGWDRGSEIRVLREIRDQGSEIE